MCTGLATDWLAVFEDPPITSGVGISEKLLASWLAGFLHHFGAYIVSASRQVCKSMAIGSQAFWGCLKGTLNSRKPPIVRHMLLLPSLEKGQEWIYIYIQVTFTYACVFFL